MILCCASPFWSIRLEVYHVPHHILQDDLIMRVLFIVISEGMSEMSHLEIHHLTDVLHEGVIVRR